MSEETDVDAAVWTLRRLDTEAKMGWPGGYDREGVRRDAAEALAVLAHSVEAAQPDYRPVLARAYVRAIAETD